MFVTLGDIHSHRPSSNGRTYWLHASSMPRRINRTVFAESPWERVEKIFNFIHDFYRYKCVRPEEGGGPLSPWERRLV